MSVGTLALMPSSSHMIRSIWDTSGRVSSRIPEEAVAFDVATALAGGKQLPGSTYGAAVAAFGKDGVGELVSLVGGYRLVSVMLNAFDMSVPGSEEGLG